MRCQKCVPITIHILHKGYKHHRSLQALKKSAEGGCEFCVLLWRSLVAEISEDCIQQYLDESRERTRTIELRCCLNQKQRSQWDTNIKVEAGGFVHCEKQTLKRTINLFTTSVEPNAGNPAYHHFTGREILQDYESHETVRRALELINNCNNNHHSICIRDEYPRLPKRVIDVELREDLETVTVCESTGSSDKYIELLFVWGKTQMKKTLDSKTSLPLQLNPKDLPRTIRDAIDLTRKLGIRYLWVDMLCITQDSVGDFVTEAPKMAQYYSNAYLTIVAGAAEDASQGFLKNPCRSTDRLEIQCDTPKKSGKVTWPGSVFACLVSLQDRRMRCDPIETRAWTLQEKLLSRRRLSLGSDQMLFVCQMSDFREDGSWSPRMHMYMPQSEADIRGVADIHPLEPRMLNGRLPTLNEQPRKEWYIFLWNCTARDLTVEADKLAAIAGMVRDIRHSPESRYLFGIWQSDTINGLLWVRRDLLPDYPSKHLRATNNSAPSWSWASYAGPTYNIAHSMPEDYRAHLLNADRICDSLDRIRTPPVYPQSREFCLQAGILHVWCLYSSNQSVIFKRHSLRIRTQLAQENLDSGRTFLLTMGLSRCIPVGIGALDTWPDESIDESADLSCLHLTREAGLLLVPAERGKFRRVGVFWVEETNWPAQLVIRRVTLV